jgi:hypothetical protein
MSGRAKAIGLGAIALVVAGAAYMLIAGEHPTETAEPAEAPPPTPTPAAPPSGSPQEPRARAPAQPQSDAGAPAEATKPDASASLPPATPSTAPPRTAPITASNYQAEQMETLRNLVETEPQKAVDLARLANRRFPKSPDAPERSWIVVKGLANLKRFHEARDEAKAMLQKYPDNHFARDAERHLMVYPLDQPSREQMQQQERTQQK